VFKTSFIIGIAGLLLLSVGLLFAQTPEVTPEAFDCTPKNLIEAQAELSTRLDNFADDLESDDALKNLYEVGKLYQEIALTCGYIPDDIDKMVINTTDTGRILNVLMTLYGDPLRGQLLYNGQENTGGGVALGCSGCHNDGINAPFTEGTWTRWDEIHSLEPQFEDYTFEQYIVESIIHPWDYQVEGYPIGTMPNFYHTQLSYQDLADIIVYLSSQDQLIED
jgi:hypothetical protein